MKERQTQKSLKVFLFISLMMTFNAAIQIFVNMYEGRPYWLIGLLFLPIPVFIFTAIMISLDLVKQDYVTLRGRLVAKKGAKIILRPQLGEVRKFRIGADQMQEINENDEIELTYFKRTKAVVSIGNLNRGEGFGGGC
ncbi:hypothetical protein [Paenibacillus roseipurpureus]|uniref:Uncharacterized protein n=1 Tax=Paenibacillus roseopurpureus TaxID=2918901 RepID=A0AA96RI84_9BACL|nr:hypothetical protein [Paenibacillus sp. MBLB1832]WNR44073.1 hypothetical protein MJB10_23730 [Paenibacillus sp. MBLB1832]